MSFGPSGNNASVVLSYFGNGDLNNEHRELHERLDNKWSRSTQAQSQFVDPVTPFNGSAVYDFKYVVAEYITDYSEVGELYDQMAFERTSSTICSITSWLITKARN